jgi:arginase family enzyme
MPLASVRDALTEALRSTYLVGLTITQYNPDKDPDSSGAKKLVDLLVESLSVRLEAPAAAPSAETAPAPTTDENPVAPE